MGHKETPRTITIDHGMEENKELEKIFSISEKEYGSSYKDQLFEQYKIYLKMIDKLNDRRATANSFFLSISTGLLAALGILFNVSITSPNNAFLFIGSISGILFCYAWVRTVKSYRQLSAGKWKIVIAIEKKIPLSLHEIEWKILGEGKNKSLYKPITDVEQIVPGIFLGIYTILILVSIIPQISQFINYALVR